MSDPYAEPMAKAKATAQAIVAACAQYEMAPSPATLNQFLSGVEKLADIAEDIEVARTVAALDA
jgi:hypothetical protein